MNDKTLDCSDLDRYLGKPIAPARLKEPLHNNDFRRWVQAMHYANLLHYDHDFAAKGRYGRLVAPQSFAVATDDGHGAGPPVGEPDARDAGGDPEMARGRADVHASTCRHL